MSEPYSPQPYEADDDFDPEATYAPKPYMPPPAAPNPYAQPPVPQPPLPQPPMMPPYPPYQQQMPPYPAMPYGMHHPMRAPRRYNSVGLHILLFFFTGGIGNAIYAWWVWDSNKRAGY